MPTSAACWAGLHWGRGASPTTLWRMLGPERHCHLGGKLSRGGGWGLGRLVRKNEMKRGWRAADMGPLAITPTLLPRP